MAKNKEENKEKKSPIKLIVIILLIGVIGTGSFLTYTYFFKDKDKVVGEDIVVNEKTFSLESFTCNLADKKPNRYIKTTIHVGYDDNKKLAEELEEKKAILRDSINTILMSKKQEELDSFGIQKLKSEIMVELNLNLTEGKIINVYFYDIIVQ